MLSSTSILLLIVVLYKLREKFSKITLAIGLLLRCGSRLADPHLLVVRAVTTPVRVEQTGAVLQTISSGVFVCVLGLRACFLFSWQTVAPAAREWPSQLRPWHVTPAILGIT